MTSRRRLPGGQELTVLNPRGNPPPIPVLSMAARTTDLSKRTVYFVDVRFMNGDILLREMQQAFSERYPGVRTEFRQKTGGYAEDDQQLWAEIKRDRGLLVMAIGH